MEKMALMEAEAQLEQPYGTIRNSCLYLFCVF